jgi:hypothetical protein
MVKNLKSSFVIESVKLYFDNFHCEIIKYNFTDKSVIH